MPHTGSVQNIFEAQRPSPNWMAARLTPWKHNGPTSPHRIRSP